MPFVFFTAKHLCFVVCVRCLHFTKSYAYQRVYTVRRNCDVHLYFSKYSYVNKSSFGQRRWSTSIEFITSRQLHQFSTNIHVSKSQFTLGKCYFYIKEKIWIIARRNAEESIRSWLSLLNRMRCFTTGRKFGTITRSLRFICGTKLPIQWISISI